ncbi:rnhA operon protein [Natrinema saccharevitans]|uniref:RnhA operon protein n=1 Tax=Natrinema saccharevitans TaxID=301967 RepID=A0A1S8AW11_9EURY|nr:rnhA operon protein [Natrinema saccharevitans]OLZ40865.1 rnhA operon protein [Natrinema saccharevitans]
MSDPDRLTADIDTDELPAEVVEEAERLTRTARETPDENEAQAHRERREDLLADHAFTSRIRDDEGDDVLVLHPEEWHDEDAGVIRTDRIDDLSRAVEIPLEGTEDPDDWAAVDDRNRDLVAAVREAHGDVHGDNAALLADFAGNHYAKPIASLTADELAEFREEYLVRNAWPSEKQREAIAESIELVFEAAGESAPTVDSQ